MSVIAKFAVRGVSHFGTGQAVDLSCWCENDLMAAYATDEQDKLFTKYSPWGEMRVNTLEHFPLGKAGDEFGPASAFYVMCLSADEAGEIADAETRAFPGATTFLKAECKSLLHLAGDERVVEFRLSGKQPHRGVEGFAWKMAVNNPGATDQMKPGGVYWIAFYDTDRFDRNAAIRAAHGHDA